MHACPGRMRRAARTSSNAASTGSSGTTGCRASAAEQIAAYLAEGKRALGVVPTRGHARARALLRRGGRHAADRCTRRSAAASTRRGASRCARNSARASTSSCRRRRPRRRIVLSLGPSHSFPLEEVFRYLNPKTVRETLVQAVLDSPIFETRWRWTTTISLAVPRNRNGAQRAGADPAHVSPRTCSRRSSPMRRPASRTSRARARCPSIRWSIRRCATAWKRRWICRG